MKSFIISIAAVLGFIVPMLWTRSTAWAADVFRTKIGGAELVSIYERQTKGNTDILLRADPDDITKFVPEDGVDSAIAVFVLKNDDDVILFDTGFGVNIASALEAIGLSTSSVTKVMLTHAHGDHIGGLAVGSEPAFPSATVYISRREYDWSAQARDALSRYGDKIYLIDPCELDDEWEEIVPGVRAVAAYGHTPGHTVYQVRLDGEELIIWGDLTHIMQVQMPRPRLAVTYDTDKDDAIRIRLELLEHIVSKKALAAGMHVPFPGVGTVAHDLNELGGYTFAPADGDIVR